MIRTATLPEFSQTLYQKFAKYLQNPAGQIYLQALKRSVYTQTFNELSRCSDRELIDISIPRYDIPKVARAAAQEAVEGKV